MATHQFFHEITIARTPEAVFDYVTNPNYWHEWFSPSLPTSLVRDGQTAGHSFKLRTTRRSSGYLPFSLVRSLDCTVTKSDRPYLWELEADSSLVDAITSYTLSHNDDGTVFKRQFSYTTKGWLKYAEPVLFRRRIVAQGRMCLERLRDRLETRQ